MTLDESCAAYLAALQAGDLEAVVALFTEDGVVHSPLYGRRPARAFYEGLFADTNRSVVRPKAVFTAPDGSFALHFDYEWTLANGTVVDFEVVDVFHTAADGRFRSMTIIYDTHPLRAEFERSRAAAQA